MAAYIVALPANGGTRKADVMIVSATDTTNAKEIARSHFGGASDDLWASATVTAVADVLASANDALVGWRFNVLVIGADDSIIADVTATGVDASDNIDEIAALLVTALNATTINNAAYNSTTQVLTIATGSGGDDIGDSTVICKALPPITYDGNGTERKNRDVPITGFFGSPTHEGLDTAALSVTLAADGFVLPTVYASYLIK